MGNGSKTTQPMLTCLLTGHLVVLSKDMVQKLAELDPSTLVSGLLMLLNVSVSVRELGGNGADVVLSYCPGERTS